MVASASHMLLLSLWEALLSDPRPKQKCMEYLFTKCQVLSLTLFNSYINFQITFDYEKYPTH